MMLSWAVVGCPQAIRSRTRSAIRFRPQPVVRGLSAVEITARTDRRGHGVWAGSVMMILRGLGNRADPRRVVRAAAVRWVRRRCAR